jgi:hypothetical protein
MANKSKQILNVGPFQRVIAFALGMIFIVLLNLIYRTFILDSAKVIKDIIRSNHSSLIDVFNVSETSSDTISKVFLLKCITANFIAKII